MRLWLSIAILLVLPLAAAAHAPSIPAADTPELAALGPYPGPPRVYTRALLRPSGTPVTITTDGSAATDAAAAPGRLPLVIVSHGFGGWPAGMSYLTENLAPQGYGVVSIARNVDWSGDTFRLSVGNAVVNRAADQQAAIAEMVRRAGVPGDPIGAHVDAAQVAVIGYSMGGFGALTMGGAGYDPGGPTPSQLPPALLARQAQVTRIAEAKSSPKLDQSEKCPRVRRSRPRMEHLPLTGS